MENIGSLVRQLEQDDQDGSTTISKYVEFNQRENLDKIDAYLLFTRFMANFLYLI